MTSILDLQPLEIRSFPIKTGERKTETHSLVCLVVCLFVWLFGCLSVCLSVRLSVRLSVCLSVCRTQRSFGLFALVAGFSWGSGIRRASAAPRIRGHAHPASHWIVSSSKAAGPPGSPRQTATPRPPWTQRSSPNTLTMFGSPSISCSEGFGVRPMNVMPFSPTY